MFREYWKHLVVRTPLEHGFLRLRTLFNLAQDLAHPELARHTWDYLTADDAGNAPRSPRAPEGVRPLIMWAFHHGTWPAEWAGDEPKGGCR